MAFKVNYGFQKAERDRLKKAKKEAKAREREAARTGEAGQPAAAQPAAGQSVPGQAGAAQEATEGVAEQPGHDEAES